MRIKRVLFAVDQQPYLQGYTPVMLLAERARHGLFPARGELIATGPQFITASDVDGRADRAQPPRPSVTRLEFVRSERVRNSSAAAG